MSSNENRSNATPMTAGCEPQSSACNPAESGEATRHPQHSSPMAEAFARQGKRLSGVLDHDLFFIVGCEKSGTSWLQHLLNSHHQIACRGESRIGLILLPLLRQAIEVWNQNHLLGKQGSLDEAAWQHFARTAAALVFDQSWPIRPHTRVIGEKTPGHAKAIADLSSIFPQAKFIHIIRDGRDGVVSGWHHNMHRGKPDFRQRFPRFADYTRYFVQAHWLPYIASARAFGSQHPARYHELRYEDLHSAPETTVERLLAFLNVDAAPEHVQACIESGSFSKLSKGRDRGEEKADSHFRKGVVGDWRNVFDDTALEAFMAAGGREMLQVLGYDIHAQVTGGDVEHAVA
ncbi:MAG: sulfotransferase family protein [Planctomycetota bacterium]